MSEEALDDAEINSLFEFKPLPISKIKVLWIRRMLMILMFPVYLFMLVLLNVGWAPFLLLFRLVGGVYHLYKSMVNAWGSYDAKM